MKLIIFTDGGARGNPGPAGIGAVFCNESGGIIKKYGEYIGEATNNEAEYRALIFALKKAKSLFGKEKVKKAETECFLDSELVVKQLNAEYKIKENNLVPLFIEVWNLKQDFGKVFFRHIPREQNREADKMVNEALDNKENQGSLL